MWFENHVHDVILGDGVGSQNTQLLAQSRYYKQTQFIHVWDYLWSDKEIAQLRLILQNNTKHNDS